MIAKFLDDNKSKNVDELKKWIRTDSDSIDLVQFQIICQNLYWLNFVGLNQKDPVLNTNASPD